MWFILLLVGLAFAGYAYFVFYDRSSTEQPAPARAWAAIVAAAGSIGTAIVAMVQGWASPIP